VPKLLFWLAIAFFCCACRQMGIFCGLLFAACLLLAAAFLFVFWRSVLTETENEDKELEENIAEEWT